MKKTVVDLKRIIDSFDLDKTEIANELFPDIKYPSLALNRIINNEAKLDSDQLYKLAAMLDIEVGSLYNKAWKLSSGETGKITLARDNYRAVLNTNTFELKIFLNESLVHETLFLIRNITLTELVESINNYINKLEE